ncbi:DUF4123 domain-containing protein [Lysobacter cavernae]|uniref:DUF4123 domain-containing protein n=1 Tax=Lysobacter cavernae TaxID=1685901 RepID=A0ABV7RSU5_9GAMM
MNALYHRSLEEHAFAVVNPLQVPPAQWRDLPHRPLVPKTLAAQPHLLPILVDLGQMDATSRVGLLERSERWDRGYDEPFFSALLTTDATDSQVAQHLTRQMMVRGPAGGENLLRLFDPRVFRHLRWLLTPMQLDALLGPIDAWTWRDQHQSWKQQLRTTRVTMHWRPSGVQWDSLARLGLLNRVLKQLGRVEPALVCDDDLAQRADRLLRESWEVQGLVDEADRRIFAEQALRFHADIHRHPQLAQRLAQARAGECSYVGACSDLDDTSMRGLARQTAQDTTRTIA